MGSESAAGRLPGQRLGARFSSPGAGLYGMPHTRSPVRESATSPSQARPSYVALMTFQFPEAQASVSPIGRLPAWNGPTPTRRHAIARPLATPPGSARHAPFRNARNSNPSTTPGRHPCSLSMLDAPTGRTRAPRCKWPSVHARCSVGRPANSAHPNRHTRRHSPSHLDFFPSCQPYPQRLHLTGCALLDPLLHDRQ